MGMAVRRPSTGRASATSATSASPPVTSGRRQISRPQRANASLRCCTAPAQGSAKRSMRGPRRASSAGSRVSEAASTNPTASRIPSALVRNGWLGTIMTAASDASTATPLTSTALPALSIVSATASTGRSPARSAARKRTTTKSA